jgi:hypothetical protein
VKTEFWAANIPGDWNDFEESKVASALYKDLPLVHIGKVDESTANHDPNATTPKYGKVLLNHSNLNPKTRVSDTKDHAPNTGKC